MRDLACARTYYLGESTHMGMPLLPMDDPSIERVSRRLTTTIPDLRRVSSIGDADIIVSVVFAPALPTTTHAPPKPDTEWSAVIERGGPDHKTSYPGGGPFISFGGRIVVGTDAVGGFARQLAAIRTAHPCGGYFELKRISARSLVSLESRSARRDEAASLRTLGVGIPGKLMSFRET